MTKLLDVQNLRTSFHISEGVIRAVDDVSFHIEKGETLAIVGESGCGKSQTALSIMRLIQTPPGRIDGGSILFEDEDLLTLSERAMLEVRGHRISMIFQEPMTSLNPVFTIGFQLCEQIERHLKLTPSAAEKRAIELLKLVGIPAPEKRIREYPHQMSGGMRQRVMIAMALSCDPQLLIADEPTTALDVTIQAQILELIRRLKSELGMSVLLITHDLGVVAEMAARVVVMYAGKVVEEADVKSLFKKPYHPYTQGLMASIPQLNTRVERLHVISGVVPNLLYLPGGCRFHPRCPYAKDRCREMEPEKLPLGDSGRLVSCWYPLADREVAK